jgi:WD40 repeat protein
VVEEKVFVNGVAFSPDGRRFAAASDGVVKVFHAGSGEQICRLEEKARAWCVAFSPDGKNWAGKPLRTLELMLGYIRGTTTTTGLTVEAHSTKALIGKGRRSRGKT